MEDRTKQAYCFVREHLGTTAERMKRRYDLRVRPQQFRRGQWVLYYNPRKFQGRQQKWQRKFSPHLIIRELRPINYMIQKSKRSRPFIAHVDKLKLYEGGNLPKSWLTDVDDGQTGGVDGVGVHSRSDGVDDNGAGNVGGTGAESGINGLPNDVVANALPAGVATIDEINNWSGSGDVIGIAAQGDGVHSPVGVAGAIDGALPENNGSSVESAPGV